MEDKPDGIDVEVHPTYAYAHLRCDDESFARLVECLRSQPGVTGDLSDNLKAITIEKRPKPETEAPKSGKRGDRVALFGCALFAIVVIFGFVNGVRTIYEAFCRIAP